MLAFFIISVFARDRILINEGWKFKSKPNSGSCGSNDFTVTVTDTKCEGLVHEPQYLDRQSCMRACCNSPKCEMFEWCEDLHKKGTPCQPYWSCWLGQPTQCKKHEIGWQGGARKIEIPKDKSPGDPCEDPECKFDFDDSSWEVIDVPHDFVIETPFDKENGHHSRGYKVGKIAWYRLNFKTPPGVEDKSVWIDFEGVMRNFDVYHNGKFIGHHNSGYIGVQYALQLSPSGQDNLIAVRLDSRETEGWWYDGGGIYRHVWLTIVDHVHISPYGVFANITISSMGSLFGGAKIDAQVTISNDKSAPVDFKLNFQLIDSDDQLVLTNGSEEFHIDSHEENMFQTMMDVPGIELWSPEHPVLYTFRSQILIQNEVVDEADTTIGFRRVQIDPKRGFLLNGLRYSIKGIVNHQDFAGVGVAVPDSLQKFRVAKMKEMGANGWRMAHNPPTPSLLDECDRQGFLVMDENHRNYVHDQYLDDLRMMLRRDRNHPSIVLWSICNERLCMEWNNANAKILKETVKEFDSGPNARPVIAAIDDPDRVGDAGPKFMKMLDVIGLNYRTGFYAPYHNRFDDQMIMGSETASALNDRGIYETDRKEYVNAYDENAPWWANTAQDAWAQCHENRWMGGCFVWTGFDFKGETTPYTWPNVNSHFGIVDIAGFPKDSFWFYKQNWQDLEHPEKVVHCFPHWNWDHKKLELQNLRPCVKRCKKEDAVITQDANGGFCDKVCRDKHGDVYIEVWAYTNARRVDVYVNGEKLGKSQASKKEDHLEWLIEYIPGTLECRAFDEWGKVTAIHSIQTSGEPAGLKIEAEQGGDGLIANKDDIALLKISVVDEKGIFNPLASNMIFLEVSGPGKIIGVGNGDPSCHEPDKATQRSAWNGLMRGIVQATNEPGEIIVTAKSEGLKSSRIVIRSRAPKYALPTYKNFMDPNIEIGKKLTVSPSNKENSLTSEVKPDEISQKESNGWAFAIFVMFLIQAVLFCTVYFFCQDFNALWKADMMNGQSTRIEHFAHVSMEEDRTGFTAKKPLLDPTIDVLDSIK